MAIEFLRPSFDPTQFNFSKSRPEERLLDLRFEDFDVAILVNVSPITKFHCLIVPGLHDNLPQVLTHDAIKFSIRLLRILNSSKYKIGYNSPGAAASVNHLHLHLIHMNDEFFAQRAVSFVITWLD